MFLYLSFVSYHRPQMPEAVHVSYVICTSWAEKPLGCSSLHTMKELPRSLDPLQSATGYEPGLVHRQDLALNQLYCHR